MAKKLELSLACGDYEIVRPLKLGLVEPEGIELNILNIESRERHWRMGRNEEFDICEFNRITFDTDSLVQRIGAQFPKSTVDTIDRQTWYAAELPQPIVGS